MGEFHRSPEIHKSPENKPEFYEPRVEWEPDSARILSIYIAEYKGCPMKPVRTIYAIKDIGLDSDRYALGIGAYSNAKPPIIREVSLIDEAQIYIANRLYDSNFLASDTRRNIVTIGVNLPDLIGKEFSIGNVRFYGTGVCEPCDRPSQLSRKPNFKEAMKDGRGGIRAQVLSSGPIQIGDRILVIR